MGPVALKFGLSSQEASLVMANPRDLLDEALLQFITSQDQANRDLLLQFATKYRKDNEDIVADLQQLVEQLKDKLYLLACLKDVKKKNMPSLTELMKLAQVFEALMMSLADFKKWCEKEDLGARIRKVVELQNTRSHQEDEDPAKSVQQWMNSLEIDQIRTVNEVWKTCLLLQGCCKDFVIKTQ